MATFELPRLNRFLIEKVITKLDWKSYFRMRRTCREIDELIRTSRNICVYFPTRVEFDRYSPIELSRFGNPVKYLDVFYGVRVDFVILAGNGMRAYFYLIFLDGDVEQLFDFLRKRRITCLHLNIEDSQFTKEECVKLFHILKPSTVIMSSTDSDRYEAVLQSTTLSGVNIKDMKGNDIVPTLPSFLTKFKDVRIEGVDKSDVYQVLETSLRTLRIHRPPKLHDLRLCVKRENDQLDWKKAGKKLGTMLNMEGKWIWEKFPDDVWYAGIQRHCLKMYYTDEVCPPDYWSEYESGYENSDGDYESSDDGYEISDEDYEISDEDYEISDDDSY